MSLVKNLLTNRRLEKKTGQGNQSMKNLQNSIKKCGRKTEKCVVRRGTLVRIRCYLVLNEVKLQIVKPPNVGSPMLCQRDRPLATCRLLAILKTKLTRIPSLSPHFLARFVTFFASCP